MTYQSYLGKFTESGEFTVNFLKTVLGGELNAGVWGMDCHSTF